MARVYEESPAPEPSFTRIRGGDRGRRGSHFPVLAFVARRQPGETNRSSPTSSVVPQNMQRDYGTVCGTVFNLNKKTINVNRA